MHAEFNLATYPELSQHLSLNSDSLTLILFLLYIIPNASSAIELTNKLLAHVNCSLKVSVRYWLLLLCGNNIYCSHNILDLRLTVSKGRY